MIYGSCCPKECEFQGAECVAQVGPSCERCAVVVASGDELVFVGCFSTFGHVCEACNDALLGAAVEAEAEANCTGMTSCLCAECKADAEYSEECFAAENSDHYAELEAVASGRAPCMGRDSYCPCPKCLDALQDECDRWEAGL